MENINSMPLLAPQKKHNKQFILFKVFRNIITTIKENRKQEIETKPEFQKEGYFSEQNLSKYSIRHLYRIRKKANNSSSFTYYMYPSNIVRAIDWLIKEKK